MKDNHFTNLFNNCVIHVKVPSAKLVYNNSPSFNWTLNFRQQVYDEMLARGDDVTDYDRALLMSSQYDLTPLGLAADQKIKTFQCEASQMADFTNQGPC